MKLHCSLRCLPSGFSRRLYGCAAAMAIVAAPLMAAVKVEFKNTGLTNATPASLGTVTLAFTVDGSGNVTLNASTSSTAPASVNAVNAWDGAVGTISHPGAYNSTFTLTMGGFGTGTSSNDLRLTDIIGAPAAPVSTGGIVGVPGINQFRIDNNASETIRFTATSVPAGSKLKLISMDWLNSSGSPTQRAWSPSPSVNATNAVTTAGGTWDLSSSGFTLGASELVNFGTTVTGDTGKGYSFRAISFDIIDASSVLPPSNLTASTDGTQVNLDWNVSPTSGVTYSVYRSATAGGPYGAAIATGLTASDYTDNTVSIGSTYYYVVSATNSSLEESDTSNEASVLVSIQPPTGLVRTQGDGVINLDWADNTSGILDFYTVYRSETPGGPYTQTETHLTASEYSDTTVTNGTTYYYVVTATDNVLALESANSVQVSGTPYAPVSGSALFAHLDGSDAASVTADGGDTVSLWADQTANDLDATSTGGEGTVYYPSLTQSESGLYGLDMGFTSVTPKSTLVWFTPAQQDQWLDFNNGAGALPYGGFAVFAVVHPEAILGGVNRDVVMSSTESNFALRYEGGRPQIRLGNSVLQGTVGAVKVGQTVVLGVNYNAATGLLQLWDSESNTITTATVPAADFSSGANIFLGGSSNPDQYMQGMLGEAKVYRGVMSATEFGNQGAEMAFKWSGLQTPTGLTASSGAGTVELDWNDQVADFYTVYRSETTTGPYTQVATNILTSDYTDTGVTEGVVYYYVVTATESTYGESQNSNEVAIRPYTSVAGNELYVHLDATNAESVTTTSGVVNVWQDLTANGIDAIEVPNGTPEGEVLDTGDVLYPSTSLSASGLAGLDFGPTRNVLSLFGTAAQDNWLDFSSAGSAQPYSGFAVFIALKADSILGELARDVVFANADNILGKFVIRYESGRPAMYLNGVAAVQGANRIVAGDTVILAANYNSATGALEFWDSASGTSANATVPAADFSSLKDMQLGGSVNVAQRMDGMIGEVKIYRGTMEASAFASERDALVAKWITEPAGGFSAWQTANTTTGAIDEDHDGDGVSNGVEYFLGGDSDTTGTTVLPGVVNTAGVLSVTWNKGTGYAGVYDTDFWVETSTTLIGEWTRESLGGGNITDDAGFVRYTFPAPLTGKRFVRLKVTGP